MTADKKSICFIIPKFVTFSTGGAEIQVHKLSQQFLKHGWRVEVVCRGSNHRQQISESPFFDARIRYHYYRRSSFLCFDFFKVFFRLCQTRTTWLYNRTDDGATAAMVMYARLTGKKSIYAIASDSDLSIKKYTSQFSSFEFRNPLKRWLRLADIKILDGMIEWAKRKTTLVFCQTATQQEELCKNFNRSGIHIPNSFDIKQTNTIEKENIILWVGNFRPVKQPEIFIQLAQRLKHHTNWQFVMIGEPDAASLPLIAQVENEPTFSFKGQLDYEETHRWFLKSKIAVNTSIIEGVPNTFIQAWMAQCYVVSLNVDPDQLLTKNGLGKFFGNAPDRMAEYLDQWLTEPPANEEELNKAYLFANEQFDINRNIDKIMHQLQKTENS